MLVVLVVLSLRFFSFGHIPPASHAEDVFEFHCVCLLRVLAQITRVNTRLSAMLIISVFGRCLNNLGK